MPVDVEPPLTYMLQREIFPFGSNLTKGYLREDLEILSLLVFLKEA